MNRISRKLLSILLLVLTIPVRADEGMWLISLIEKVNGKALADKGFTVTPDDIFSLDHSSIKDAVVQFGGGCTGEIVSDRGLLFTNHHCGFNYIRQLSSVEHNYLNDGYWAMQSKEELPVDGLTVSVLESITDVTSKVEKAASNGNTATQITLLQKQFADEAGCDGKLKVGVLKSFFGGNSYYFIVYKVFCDVRFVGAPPLCLGKFGSETDNWMWPRHTGDFSVFRIYADRENNPAEYSEDNVPYTPKKFLSISLKGIQENDPAMIVGYPGSTNRFMTKAEVIEKSEVSNALNIKMRTIYQNTLLPDMEEDPDIMIKYSAKYFSSSNGWKKMVGMNQTLARLEVARRCGDEEERFSEWVKKGGKKRIEKYGNVLSVIEECIKSRHDALFAYTALTESLCKITLLRAASIADHVLSYMNEEDEAKKKEARKELDEYLNKFYTEYTPECDKKVAKAFVSAAKEILNPEFLPSFYSDCIDARFSGDVDSFVEWLYDASFFTSREKLLDFAEKGDVDMLITEDPAAKFYIDLSIQCSELNRQYWETRERFNEAKKAYIAGTMEMHPKDHFYPDANFTMRLTYGSVLPYSPKDAVFYNYYTTLDGVMEKEDSTKWEFKVPPKLKELWKNKDFGAFAMPDGRLPVAFITNCDITGGNSGSPTMNGRGELVGLAFDGNWEAMSSDILYEPLLQRCISVDIRYVLFLIDKLGGAGYLLNEMDIKK